MRSLEKQASGEISEILRSAMLGGAELPPSTLVSPINSYERPAPEVRVYTFSQLFTLGLPLALDSYQRSYVWGEEKVNRLLSDLLAYEAKAHEKSGFPDYYMGTVLLHRDTRRNCFFVVDGQQRLTTLLILYRELMQELPDTCQMRYSTAAEKNLRTAHQVVAHAKTRALPGKSIFHRIHFTVITVGIIDDAFTFFDTQNNRGVPLATTDLLKAHHLRAIPESTERSRLQEACAKGWEQLQNRREVLGSGADLAPLLFTTFLWRARRWRGSGALPHGEREEILGEFQERPLSAEGDGSTVPLYRSEGNQLGQSLQLMRRGGYELKAGSLQLNPGSARLPFAVRQPITKGLGFFLYAEKYAALLQSLLDSEEEDLETRAFVRFYRAMWSRMSIYLQEVYLLAALMYVDQFGTAGLLRFALWLDYSLGSLRMQSSVRWQTAYKYLQERGNLLDVIAGSFIPSEVIDFLSADALAQLAYEGDTIDSGVGVRGRYKNDVLAWYGQANPRLSLRGRGAWITEKFIAEQLQETTVCK